MANLEKHVKALAAQLAEAESNLVPSHARGSYLMDRYIKASRRKRNNGLHSKSTPSQVRLRLDAVPATPEAQQRIRKRALELNTELKLAKLPFRLRVI